MSAKYPSWPTVKNSVDSNEPLLRKRAGGLHAATNFVGLLPAALRNHYGPPHESSHAALCCLSRAVNHLSLSVSDETYYYGVRFSLQSLVAVLREGVPSDM